MFCIAAFIVLLVLGAISAKYRKLLKKSWGCVTRRVTFRPCDTGFSEELKATILAPIAVKKPRLVKPAEILIQILSVLIVLTTIWSLLYVAKAGASYYVYGTCSPAKGESCSLSAEACYVDSGRAGFWGSLWTGKLGTWFEDEWKEDQELIEALPNRLKTWNATDYTLSNATYLEPYDSSKPTLVEIVDPGCLYCAKLFKNLEESSIADSYNVTYVAYPIPLGDGKYKFSNSYLIASYLEAVRQEPLVSATTPVDWEILARIYSESNSDGVSYQNVLNGATSEKVEATLQAWLEEFGYSSDEISSLVKLAHSTQTADALVSSGSLVENNLKTISIPTVVVDGRRYDKALTVDELKDLGK